MPAPRGPDAAPCGPEQRGSGLTGIVGAGDSGFGDGQDTLGYTLGKSHCALGIDMERVQITLVHADECRVYGESAVQFHLVVHLDEGVETHFDSKRMQLRQLTVTQCGNDEQHGIRTHQSCVENVERTHRDILAKNR